MEDNDTGVLIAELRGWHEIEGMSDDARRKLWLMRKAADAIERLQTAVINLEDEVSEAYNTGIHDGARLG